MLTPRQIELARKAHQQFKVVALPGKRPLDDRDLQVVLRSEGLVESSLSVIDENVAGFTAQGMSALGQLADDLRGGRAQGRTLVSRQTLAKTLARVAISHWKARAVDALAESDLTEFANEIAAWFDRQDQVRVHYIPCAMSAWEMPPFAIGPVQFYPKRQFPVSSLGLDHEDVWPSGGESTSSMADICLIEGIFQLAAMRNAETIAEVAVPGREKRQSALTADIAVDVALAIFQLLMPPGLFTRAARATGRSAPVWTARLSRDDEGVSPQTTNDEPGRSFAPGGVAMVLKDQAELLASTGRRLEAYLDGSGAFPMLDEAWCNAAYWYHEALAEPLETVAIAKLETAIEVLFRAENSSGSKSRLIQGIEAFFELSKGTVLRSGITVDQFAASIVTARSRILHGTWPTLHTELPDAKGGVLVSINDAEALARLLLLQFSVALDGYAAADERDDTVEALLKWRVRTSGADAEVPAA